MEKGYSVSEWTLYVFFGFNQVGLVKIICLWNWFHAGWAHPVFENDLYLAK